jgi:hypothetical protein
LTDHAQKARRDAITDAHVVELMEVLWESLLCVAIATNGVIQCMRAVESDSRLHKVYGDVLRVPWANTTVTYQSKVAQYFVAMAEVDDLLNEERMCVWANFALVLLCILQLIAYMTVRPVPELTQCPAVSCVH